MKFYDFISMYDDYYGKIVVNDNNLKQIFAGYIYDAGLGRTDLHNLKVVSFGFYDGELTVRLDV